MNFDLIIFDCDGTLVDTEYAVNAAFLESVYKLAPPEYKKFDVAYILKNCIGGTVYDIFGRMAQDVKIPLSNNVRDQIIKDYQDIVPKYLKIHVQHDPNLIEIIKKLSSYFKVCVASNGRIRNVVNSLDSAGLSALFGQNIFSAEQVNAPKPAPDLIFYAAQKMEVSDMSRVLHIEDTDRGVMAGVKAGAKVIGFTGHSKDKVQSSTQMISAGALEVFDRWKDVYAFTLK